jgi:hypothetical protein
MHTIAVALVVALFLAPTLGLTMWALIRWAAPALARVARYAFESVRPDIPPELEPAKPLELVADYNMVHHLERLNGIPLSEPEPEVLEYDVAEQKCGDPACSVCGVDHLAGKHPSQINQGTWADGQRWAAPAPEPVETVTEGHSRASLSSLQNALPAGMWSKRRILSGQSGPVELLAACSVADHPEAVMHSWNGYAVHPVCDHCLVDIAYLA